MFYPGKVHSVFGESESLKSWLCQYGAVQEINAGNAVLYVDFEDDEGSVVSRMLALGANPGRIRERLRYIRPDGPLAPGGADAAGLYQLAAQSTLAVLDGVSEAMVLHGLDPDKGTKDAAEFFDLLPRPLAQAGAATVMIDHIPKNTLPGTKNALGAQHKRAGINGASYSVRATETFGFGLHGQAVIEVAKDRPGQVRSFAGGPKHDEIGVLHLESLPDRSVLARLEPAETHDPAKPFRPTILMERISRYLETAPDAPLSTSKIEQSVSGNARGKRQGLDRLVAEGYVTVEQAGQSRLHRSIRPFRDDQPSEIGTA
ncbi:hypothetical protein KBI5_15470 [Frankia sp. KB5]|nr:hypothetical protein KBI5_15470 [Frankia sp. KB5]